MKKIYQRAMAVALAGTTLFGAGLWHKHHRICPVPSKQVTKNADALPTGVSEATLADIRSSLEKQEYHISFDNQKKKLQSPNRRNNIRAYYEPGKLTVQTRVDTAGVGFKMELVNEGIFADGKLLYAPEISAKAGHHENKVRISHSAFTEEFINNEDGVRQNFIIEHAPEGTRQLQVKMTAKGLKVEQGSGNELRFYSETADGQTRNELVYSDLKCWDANKNPLNATLAYVDNRIQISVDVANAAYPVTIDPIIANGTPQNSNKVLEINQSYMHLGFSVSSAGDVNGDGYSDVVVGAPHYDLGEDNEGGAFVYKGGPFVLTATAVTFQSNQKDAQMGYSVASAGDFNGDGYSDVLVGVPYYDKTATDEGRANLYLGSSTFFDDPITSYSLGSGQAGALMGLTVATAGDIDGDGFSDILVGSPLFGANKAGAVRYYKGNASGAPQNVATLAINLPNAQFGYSLAPAGDVDADGYSDIIVGARWYTNGQGQDGEGAAFIYRGGSNGLQPNPTIIEGNQYNAAMGNKVSSAGDVNGDGYSDVLISAYLFDLNVANEKDHGIVNLYLGSSNGISSQQQPSRSFYGKHNDHMGSSIACAGDVNGDGYSDILLGAEYYDNGQFNEGGVFVYHGSKGNIGIVGEPVATMESNQIDGWFGTAVASAGDVNGDGYSDIVVGVFTYDNGQNDEGIVVIYNGKPDAPGATAKVATLSAVTGASAGASVNIVGDLDGDGLDDIAVGAPNYDNGQNDEGALFVHYGDAVTGTSLQKTWEGGIADIKFGSSVSGAGDVNGDGLNDIIVGAPGKVNGLNIGAAFVILGAAKNANPGIPVELYAGGNSGFGAAVSGAGDINKDGYDDVIVGAPNGSKANTPNSGVVYIYLGSANGINPQNVTNVSSGLTNTHIGNSLSSEDTNGDGYSDIIVGANQASIGQNGEGAVFIWRGSASGIATDANFNNLLELNQPNAGMGICVAGAGDVNGDGYGDIVVGSDKYDNGQNDEGRATVFYGSSVGCGSANKTDLEINYAGAYFGRSVGGNTDVNADGYDDVIVGAPFYSNGSSNEGGVWVFYGSPDGVNVTSIFSTESNQLLAHMGASVSGGGDLNGDGYGDFVVGIPEYTQSGAVNSGSCWAYFGNNGNHGNVWHNKRNNLRLYNSNLSSPMSYQQATSVSFGLGLTGTSFTGRNNGRMVWNFATPGQKFSCVAGNPKDYPITTSTKTDNGQMAFYSLPPYEFKELVAKPVGSSFRIRARVKYELTTALTGQRFSPWRYSSKPIIYIQPLSVPEEVSNEIFTPKHSFENIERREQVTVYPNPVTDRLFIQSTNIEQVASLQLISANGTMAFTSAKPQSEVDVKNLPAGSYVLVINRKDGSKTSHKVLIRK